MEEKDIETFYPKNQAEWRQWLEKNHQNKQSVWLVQYNKASKKPTISWSDAVDQSLCFGWIDSVKKKRDTESTIQFFSKRKPNSTWSKINKAKVDRLVEHGLMTPAGLEVIKTAKQNGTWTLLDEVEELIIPADLAEAFKAHNGSEDYFLSQSKTHKKMMLQWIVLAKRPETRQNRINEIAECAGQNQRPKPFR